MASQSSTTDHRLPCSNLPTLTTKQSPFEAAPMWKIKDEITLFAPIDPFRHKAWINLLKSHSHVEVKIKRASAPVMTGVMHIVSTASRCTITKKDGPSNSRRRAPCKTSRNPSHTALFSISHMYARQRSKWVIKISFLLFHKKKRQKQTK